MNRSPIKSLDHPETGIRLERTFPRFTLGQRWEHAVLIVCFTVLLLTGLVQKYRATQWSQDILATPERLETIRTIHHAAALLLTAEAIFHLGRAIYLLARRRLSGKMLPAWKDILDAFQMLKYLLFLTKRKPEFGKFSFEQKFTYWFLFFAIGIMIVSGFIIWFPITFTYFLPGGIVPAAKLAHSTEAVAAGVFVVIWHLYHVLIERLNLSMFTGRLSEEEMRTYHAGEYRQWVNQQEAESSPAEGGEQ